MFRGVNLSFREYTVAKSFLKWDSNAARGQAMETPRSARSKSKRRGGATGGGDEHAHEPGSGGRPSSAVVFLVIGIFCVVMWGLMHRSVVNIDGAADAPPPLASVQTGGGANGALLTKSPDPKHVQMLLDETKALLKDVISANLTLNHAVLSDLEKIQEERVNVHSDLKQIQDSHKKASAELSACTSETVHLSSELEKCRTQIHNIEEKLRTSPSNKNDCSKCGGATTSTSQEGEVELPVPQHHVARKDDHDNHHHTRAQRWLSIGIPTVSRAHNEDYLLKTLSALEMEFTADPSDLMFTQVVVVVVNIQGKGHARFEEAVAKYGPKSNHPKSAYFDFITLTPPEIDGPDMRDPLEGKTRGKDMGNANVPGQRVRKQTRSIAMVMKKAAGLAKYFQFLEDDMVLCKGGLQATHHMLAKATRYHHNWIALRTSYGMNGIFLHDTDMAHFHQYLLKHQARRPPDHLAVEWFAGETKESGGYRGSRINVAYRYNIYDHIGLYSTLRSQKQTSFPRCYEMLGEPTLFQVEAFSPKQCPKDDIWPCQVQNAEHMYVRFK